MVTTNNVLHQLLPQGVHSQVTSKLYHCGRQINKQLCTLLFTCAEKAIWWQTCDTVYKLTIKCHRCFCVPLSGFVSSVIVSWRDVSYKKWDESSCFVLLHHHLQHAPSDRVIVVCRNLPNYHSSNQSSTFHWGMSLRSKMMQNLLETQCKLVVWSHSYVFSRLWFENKPKLKGNANLLTMQYI